MPVVYYCKMHLSLLATEPSQPASKKNMEILLIIQNIINRKHCDSEINYSKVWLIAKSILPGKNYIGQIIKSYISKEKTVTSTFIKRR